MKSPFILASGSTGLRRLFDRLAGIVEFVLSHDRFSEHCLPSSKRKGQVGFAAAVLTIPSLAGPIALVVAVIPERYREDSAWGATLGS